MNYNNLNYLSQVVLVLASCCSFRFDTGHSSVNNTFGIENQGATKLWELHHCNTTFSFIPLPIVSLENIEYFLKLGWEEFNSAINLSKQSGAGKMILRVEEETRTSRKRLQAKLNQIKLMFSGVCVSADKTHFAASNCLPLLHF